VHERHDRAFSLKDCCLLAGFRFTACAEAGGDRYCLLFLNRESQQRRRCGTGLWSISNQLSESSQ